MNVGKMQAPGQQHQQHLQLHPAASAAPPTQQLHLPIDYSLGNFKPAIAADFPGNPFVTSPQQQHSSTSTSSSTSSSTSTCSTSPSTTAASLQVRDLSALTSMAAIPSPTQLLHQRMQPAQITVDAHHHHQQQQHQMPPATTSPHEYAPMSAFKAVLPKKRSADGKQKAKRERKREKNSLITTKYSIILCVCESIL